jgi:hypothetical protein
VHPGVYATFTGELPREAKLWAAVLQAGAGAALSHESAAEIHELIDKPSTWIHVSVPAGRHPGEERKTRGVIIHRSRKLIPEWQPPGEPLPDSRPDCRGPAASRLARYASFVRPYLSGGQESGTPSRARRGVRTGWRAASRLALIAG